jgi:hypothetical protein
MIISLMPTVMLAAGAVTVQVGDAASLWAAIDNAEDGVLTIIEITNDLITDGFLPIWGNKNIKLTSANPASPSSLIRGITGNVINVSGGATLTLENIVIDGNKEAFPDGGSTGNGELVAVIGSTLYIENGAVLRNNANSGIWASGSTITMNGGEISGNEKSVTGGFGYGGGIFASSSSKITINGGEISDNIAYEGGGIGVLWGVEISITGGKITNNIAHSGGGIFLWSSELTMTGGEISGNTDCDIVMHVGSEDNIVTLGGTAVIDNINVSTNYITLGTGENAPAAGMRVGVDTWNGLGTFVQSGATEDDVQYFFSVDAERIVAYTNGQLKIISGNNCADCGSFPCDCCTVCPVSDYELELYTLHGEYNDMHILLETDPWGVTGWWLHDIRNIIAFHGPGNTARSVLNNMNAERIDITLKITNVDDTVGDLVKDATDLSVQMFHRFGFDPWWESGGMAQFTGLNEELTISFDASMLKSDIEELGILISTYDYSVAVGGDTAMISYEIVDARVFGSKVVNCECGNGNLDCLNNVSATDFIALFAADITNDPWWMQVGDDIPLSYDFITVSYDFTQITQIVNRIHFDIYFENQDNFSFYEGAELAVTYTYIFNDGAPITATEYIRYLYCYDNPEMAWCGQQGHPHCSGSAGSPGYLWEQPKIYLYNFNIDVTAHLRIDNISSVSGCTCGTCFVDKQPQTAPAAPTLAHASGNSITLNWIHDAEYRRGSDGAWQSSMVFTGLTPNTAYTFYARMAETATHYASPASAGSTFMTNRTGSGSGGGTGGGGGGGSLVYDFEPDGCFAFTSGIANSNYLEDSVHFMATAFHAAPERVSDLSAADTLRVHGIRWYVTAQSVREFGFGGRLIINDNTFRWRNAAEWGDATAGRSVTAQNVRDRDYTVTQMSATPLFSTGNVDTAIESYAELFLGVDWGKVAVTGYDYLDGSGNVIASITIDDTQCNICINHALYAGFEICGLCRRLTCDCSVRDELEALVESFTEDFFKNELHGYGTLSYERFIAAYINAQVLLGYPGKSLAVSLYLPGNERNLRNIVNLHHDEIVRAQNLIGLTGAELEAAKANPMLGTGALAALYRHIGGWDSSSAPGFPRRHSDIHIDVDNDGRFVSLFGHHGADSVRLRAGRPIDLTSFVRIDAQSAVTPAWVIGRDDLNALQVGLGDAYRNAQHMFDDPRGSFAPGHPDDGFVLAQHLMVEAINEMNLSPYMGSSMNFSATARDYTAAYVLLEAAYNNLLKKTQADLGTLIAATKATYDTENRFNEGGDAIYVEWCDNSPDSTYNICPIDCAGSGPVGRCGFERFAEAYEAAERYTGTDSNRITDIWLELEAAYGALVRKQVVTAAEINELNTELIRTGNMEEKFTPERRGETFAPWGERFSTFRHDTGDAWWANSGHIPLSWAVLWDSDAVGQRNNQILVSGYWWNEFIPFAQAYAVYDVAMENFGSLGTASTTNDDIIKAYNDAKDIVFIINNFEADNTARATLADIYALLEKYHNEIVTTQNTWTIFSQNHRINAIVNPTLGNGALAALYELVLASTGETAWGVSNNTNMPVAPVDFSYDFGDGPVSFRAGQAVDLTGYVQINAVSQTTPAHVIGYHDLNALPRRNYNSHRPIQNDGFFNAPWLGDAFRAAQTIESGEWEIVEVYRALLYAINDYGVNVPETFVTRARLEALIVASFAVNEFGFRFFREYNGNGWPVDVIWQVVDARVNARDVLRAFWHLNNRADLNDRVDQRFYAPAFNELNDSVNQFNSALRTFPVTMGVGERSVLDLLYSTADSKDAEIIALRDTLALRILEDETWGYMHSERLPSIMFSGNIFTRDGTIDREARLRALDGDGNPAPQPAYAAYRALLNAFGAENIAKDLLVNKAEFSDIRDFNSDISVPGKPTSEVTRVELQTLINNVSGTLLGGYGTHSVLRFEQALRHARFVSTDNSATSQDFTNAYIMLDTAFRGLLKKSTADLNEIMEATRKVYNSNNVLNAAGCAIYKEESFTRFVDAYEAILRNEELLNTKIITDLWLELRDAAFALEEKQVVTRWDINSADRNLNRASTFDEKFEPDQRGTTLAPWGEVVNSFRHEQWGAWWTNSGEQPLTWEVLFSYEHMRTISQNLRFYVTGSWWREFKPLELAWVEFEQAMDSFGDLGVSMTTAEYIVEAYNHAVTIVALINNFTDNDTFVAPEVITSRTKAQLQALVDSSFVYDEFEPFVEPHRLEWLLNNLKNNRDYAIELLTWLGDSEDDRIRFAEAYRWLTSSVSDLEFQLERFPIDVNDILELMYFTAGMDDADIINARAALALTVLEDETWYFDESSNKINHNIFSDYIFADSGRINADARILFLDFYGDHVPWPVYTAHKNLLDLFAERTADALEELEEEDVLRVHGIEWFIRPGTSGYGGRVAINANNNHWFQIEWGDAGAGRPITATPVEGEPGLYRVLFFFEAPVFNASVFTSADPYANLVIQCDWGIYMVEGYNYLDKDGNRIPLKGEIPLPCTCTDKCACPDCECDCVNKTCHDCGTCNTCDPPHVCTDKCACPVCVCDCTNKACHDCGTCNTCDPRCVCGDCAICGFIIRCRVCRNPVENCTCVPIDVGFIEDLLKTEDVVIVLEITEETGSVITPEILELFREADKSVEVQLPNGLVLTIDPSRITDNAVAIDLNIGIQMTSRGNQVEGVPANSIVIAPNTHGDFGFEIEIAISPAMLSESNLNGQNIGVWHVDANGVPTFKARERRNSDGSVSFSISSASHYVLADDINSITIESPSTTINTRGGELQLTAIINPADSLASVIWSSDNAARATVDADGLVKATAASNGSVVITATANDQSGVTRTVSITLSNQTTGGGNTSGGSGGGGGGGSTPGDVPITPTATITAGTSTWTVTNIPRAALTALGLSADIPVNQVRIPTGATGNQNISIGAAFAGQNAVLVRYNAVTNELEFVSASAVGANGSASFNIAQTGEYLVLTFKTGDITGTGEVQTTDALALLRHVAGISELNSIQQFVANGKQGENSTTDALNILRYIAGVIGKI